MGADRTGSSTVVAVANLKGGVGKTTTAVHLAAGLARLGRETLLVDLDAQGSATAHLLDPGSAGPGIVEVLRGEATAEGASRATGTERLFVLPWSGEPEAVDAFPASPDALRRALTQVTGTVVVDTPPHMGASTMAALAAADWILVPVNCEYLPILGLKQFNEALGRIRMKLRIPARVMGYVLTQVDRRERITWEVEEILRKTFGSRVFRTMIRIDTKLKTCPSHRTTIYEFEPESGRARTDYTALVDEFVARLESDD
ncbi:MAG: ParA family protein [Deltaproteobacteria bacterium]|nr:ParA family protein [Deltaproteobacteria bacterium]